MLAMGLKPVVRSSPKAPATLIPLVVGNWQMCPGQGTAQLGTSGDAGRHCCAGSPAPAGDGMGWWGKGGDSGDKEQMMGTRRRQQGSRGDGEDQEQMMGTKERWWAPRGDNKDQEGMVGTRRIRWGPRGDGGDWEGMMETRRSQWR